MAVSKVPPLREIVGVVDAGPPPDGTSTPLMPAISAAVIPFISPDVGTYKVNVILMVRKRLCYRRDSVRQREQNQRYRQVEAKSDPSRNDLCKEYRQQIQGHD